MLFKNFSSFGGRSSSVRCRDRIMSTPARKVKLRSIIPTTSSLLVGEIDPEISKQADGHPIYNMEETPPIIVGRRRFPDEFSSGSPISGKSKRTEDISIREDEDGIRSHCCPLNPELDGRDWNEDYPDRSIQFDFNFEKLVNSCSVPSEDIPLLLSPRGSSSESDEDSDGSVVGYTPLESEASTSRNSTVSLTNFEYASLENEPLTNENTSVFEKTRMSWLLQLTEKTSPYARLGEETIEAWLDDSSDEFEGYDPFVKLLPNAKPTIEDESDMEEFEQDSDSENENENLKSAKNKEKKDDGYKDKGDRNGGNKDFLADSKTSKSNVENVSSTEYPNKLSKIEHLESKNACQNEQLSNLNAQFRNQSKKEDPEMNKDESNKDLSTDTKCTENIAKIESSTELLNKMSKIENLKNENASKNKNTSQLNTEDENQNEKEQVKSNLESDSIVIDLHYSDNAGRNDIESNLNTQDENKDKEKGKESANGSKNKQPRNLNAGDENQSKKKYPEYNIESDSTAIGIHLLDNADRNSIESNLSTEDDYKDKKEEKGSENTNENEQKTKLNAEDENQNEKKYPENNIEGDSIAINIHLLDNVDKNGIESNFSTQEDYKDKKEAKKSKHCNTNEQQRNLSAEDEHQNEKKYPEYNIEDDSIAMDMNLLHNVDRNGIESYLNSQYDYKDKKEEKGSENTIKNVQPANLNAEDELENEKRCVEHNIESDSTAIDINLSDNVDRNGIESYLNIEDDYKDKKEEKRIENSYKNEQPTNLNAEDENQNQKKYPEYNIESVSTAIDIHLSDIVNRNTIESNLSTQDDYKDKKEERDSQNTNKNEQPTNLNVEEENQSQKKYPEFNIESVSTAIDLYISDNVGRNVIEPHLSTQDDYKDKKEEKGNKNTNKNEQLTNLNVEDENKNEKKYPENNIEDVSIAIDMNLFDNVDRNGIESYLNSQYDYKDKKEEKGSENTYKNVQSTNLNTKDEHQNEKRYLEYNIESDSTAIYIHLLDNVDRNSIESYLNSQYDYEDKKEVKGNENTYNNEQPTNLNAEDKNQNQINYPEYNIESHSTAIDLHLSDNVDRNVIEPNLSTEDDYKDKKKEKGNENTNKNEQPTNLNAEDDNQNEKKYPENNLENDSTETNMHYLDITERNDIESNLNTQNKNKDKKEESENDSKNEFFSEDIFLPDFDNINGSVSNLSTYSIARLKFRDLLQTLLKDKDKKEEPENKSKNDFISEVVPLVDFDNINGSVSNLNIQDENKCKNIQTESDSKDAYIFEITNFPEFVSLNGSISNLNTQEENNDNKTQAGIDLKNDYLFEIISFPDFVSLNGSVSSLSTHDKNENKKEFKSDSNNYFITEGIPLTDSYSINEPVSNSAGDENKDTKEHPESDLKTDYISEGIQWADFDSANVLVSNSDTQDKNKVKEEHPESNLETGSTENFLHCADNGRKEKYVSEIVFSNKTDDNRSEFSYDFFPKSQTKPAIKPKILKNVPSLTVEPYGRTSPKSIKKDETQPGLKRLQRFMSGVYPTKDKNELHFEPSITRDVGDKMPLEEKGIIFDINDALVLADLPVHDSGGFQPVLTEEQRAAPRQPNKLTKFFQSLKKKLERNKKA